MADVVTFDPVNLIIEEINTGLSSNELDLVEIYSEWKDWLLADASRLKYPPAFRYVGADPISDVQNLGSTFFINAGDGWHIRPANYDHQLIIVGNLFTDPAGLDRTVPTVGPFTVEVVYNVSNLVDSSVARLDLLALLDAVYIDTVNGVSGTDGDIGSPTNPVNNIADAYTIATTNNVRTYKLSGSITLDRDYESWEFEGGAGSTAIFLNGFSVDGSDFRDLALFGTGTGAVDCHSVALNTVAGISGVFQNTSFTNTFTCADNTFHAFVDCVSGVAGTGRPSITFGVNTDAAFRNYSGGLELVNVTAGCVASCDMDPGDVRLLASCTGGEVLCRGVGSVDDQSTGTTVVDRMISPDSSASAVWLDTSATYSGLTGTMGGDILAGGGGASPAAIAVAVWESLVADYSGDLTQMGGKLLDGNINPSQVADAVWEATAASYTDTLEMGGLLKSLPLTATATANAVWNASAASYTDVADMGGFLKGAPLTSSETADAVWKAAVASYTGLTLEMGGGLLEGSIDAAQVADAVWEATAASYTDTLQMGGKLQDDILGTPLTGAEAANAIWEASQGLYTDPGTMGGKIKADILGTPLTVSETANAVWQATAASYSDTLEMGGRILDDLDGITPLTPTQIADAVWEAPTVDYAGATTQMGGKLLEDVASGIIDPADVAIAVWQAATNTSVSTGEMGGKILADLAQILTDIAAGVPVDATTSARLTEVWQVLGLDVTQPLTVSKTARTAGSSVTQTVEENVPVAGSVRVTRQ